MFGIYVGKPIQNQQFFLNHIVMKTF